MKDFNRLWHDYFRSTGSTRKEIVAVGVRHKAVMDSYAKTFQKFLPDRPLFQVTGSGTTFAQRRKLRKTLRESGNGILLCTQQALPSSVNFEFVNTVFIPEMHWNNAAMSQFYMRFVRFTSTEYKDIYFPTYLGSLESNLIAMNLCLRSEISPSRSSWTPGRSSTEVITETATPTTRLSACGATL